MFPRTSNAVFLGFLVLPALFAQEAQQASISGFVQDESGGSVSRAHIRVTNTATQAKRDLETDSSGTYTAIGLAAGDYDVSVRAPGFKAFEQHGVHVDIGSAVRVNIALKIGSTSGNGRRQ